MFEARDLLMHDVEIFTVELDLEDPGAVDILSADERARADRFHFDRDRRSFINCRATLRRKLACYMNMDPAAISFRYNEYGKPLVDGVHFNVSHAGGIAMIAVSRTREVGIDVERIKPSIAHEQIPERFFAPREVAALRALPESQQVEAFFGYWTRKEAYMKARGLGFALESTSFDSAELPGEWALEAISAPPGYIAALCAGVPPGSQRNRSL
jgi:4'-phosphopantetheinyl transferase